MMEKMCSIRSMKQEFLGTCKNLPFFNPNTKLRMNSTEDVSRSLTEKLHDGFQHHWPDTAITILG